MHKVVIPEEEKEKNIHRNNDWKPPKFEGKHPRNKFNKIQVG